MQTVKTNNLGADIIADEIREELEYCDPLPMVNPYRKTEEESEEFQDVAGLDYGDEPETPDDDEGMDPNENM